ncbi:MAG: PilZ domain-containing protein [Pirellulales bacterium]|nr:PilZ domain-containing protein [Pirellulales bacterium]
MSVATTVGYSADGNATDARESLASTPTRQMGSIGPADTIVCTDLRSHVWALLSSAQMQSRSADRRNSQRFPYPYLITVTPLDLSGRPLPDDQFVVVGKNISEGGLSFYHQGPLAHRQAIVSLDAADGRWMSFLVDLTWCRFKAQGWYESGGQFLKKTVTPPQLGK